MISQRPSFILTLLLKATELILASSASNDLRQKNFEITEYFKPFGNCTIIVSIPKKVVHVLNQEVKNAPIIIFGLFSKQGGVIERKFSIVARRNLLPTVGHRLRFFQKNKGTSNWIKSI